MFPVPLNSSKITSSILDPVSVNAVAIIVSDPPFSILRAAPKKRFGLCNALASTPPESIFPAIDLTSSSTRRDDILLDATTIQRMWVMRKYLADMNPVEAMEFINDRFKQTRNNEEFLISMNG